MSNREKRAPADPAEERAMLRQLTRELHEAAKDARGALRELRELRGMILADVAQRLGQDTAQAMDELRDEFKKTRERVQESNELLDKRTQKAVENIEENHARLMGFTDSTQFARFMVTEVFKGLAGNPQFVRDVGAAMRDLQGGRGFGEIRVGTQEQLDAYIAAGGDPGLVLG